jgi:elongation factor G
MNLFTTKSIRNIALVGHGGDGKTSLAEAMLFDAGLTDRLGKVEEGNTHTDFDPEEINRKISIMTGFALIERNKVKINVIDAPGYFDFIGETVQAYSLADSAVIVVSAKSGLSVGAEKAWDYCDNHNLARAFFINQMDKENVNYDKAFATLKDKYGVKITPIQIPIGDGLDFKGIIDVIDMKAYDVTSAKSKEIPIPNDLKAKAEEIRNGIVENAAENDEELLEKFFSGEDLTKDDIVKGLQEGIEQGDVVPVFVGSATHNMGIDLFLDNIVTFLPSPDKSEAYSGVDIKTEEPVNISIDATKPFIAKVCKTVADPFVGKLSVFKILQGEITPGMSISNINKGKSEKFGSLYVMDGKKQKNVEKLVAGDIGAISKLNVTKTSDTLADSSVTITLDPLDFPEPSISLAVTAKKQGEEEKVFAGLHRLEEEDPTISINVQKETVETLISGVGELQIDVICKKLKNKFHVEAELSDPKLPYRETIKKKVTAEGKHKKQSGGHGQFGDVFIDFEPIFEDKEFEFVDKVVGGSVPKQYIPAVEKGLKESMKKGVLAGYPMVNIKATLKDGKYHPVDSSEMAFKMAAYQAYKAGCALATPVLLEPIYKAEVTVPDDYMGDIIGDLNRRRGRILGMNPTNGLQVVEAEVPQSEMVKYATDLRSMTHSRGSFKLTFERYEEVPGNISAKIIEEAKKEKE